MTREEMADKLYHDQIRLSISEEYKKCCREHQQLFIKAEELSELIKSDEGKRLPYIKYLSKVSEYNECSIKLKEVEIRRDVWFQARDLCFDTADFAVRQVLGRRD